MVLRDYGMEQNRTLEENTHIYSQLSLTKKMLRTQIGERTIKRVAEITYSTVEE